MIKYMKISKITWLIASSVLLWGLTSCDNMLNIDAEEVVELHENYQNVYDADNSIWGLYGKVSALAEHVVVLNEVRGDLMDVTSNATPDLVALNNHSATSDNYYCDPTPFYDVILNANDIIFNFKKMLDENRITQTDYEPRYADVVAIRTWAFFQLAIHFDDVPYITDPLSSIEALSDPGFVSKKDLGEMLIQLISDMEELNTLETNTLSSYYNKTIQDNNRYFYLNMQFLDKRLLLGDLYLWNNEYVNAAIQYKAYMDADDMGSDKTQFNNKVSGWVWAGTNEPRFQICYQRYKDQDVRAFRNMWKEIFSRSSTDVGSSGSMALQDEMIWMISYSGSDKSASPFIRLFANTGQGEYLLKPSAYAIDSLWETQVQQSNGFVFDGRGRESSFDYVNGQPVVLKYLYDYYNYSIDANRTIHLNYNDIPNAYDKPGKWFLYRAALLHLRYAEAANRAGYPRLAYALLNNGVRANFDWPLSNGNRRQDKEGVQYSSFPPANDSVFAEPYPAPFYLDARQNDVPYTFLRSPWRDNYGIRGRAFLVNIEKPDWVLNHSDSIQWIEQSLLKEAALECGFEGHRWGDMLRIARRNVIEDGKPSASAILNQMLEPKFNAAGTGSPMLSEDKIFLELKP